MEEQRYLEIMRRHMQEFYLLDEQQVEEILPGCLGTLFEHVQRLEALQQEGDAGALAKASHAVRGALLNLGLFDLAEYVCQVETRCEELDDLPTCRSLLAELRRKLQPLYSLTPPSPGAGLVQETW
ncbi:MAG: hypothetical protein Q4G66_03205 [bacterium]|nr:hypothetical protein [bacterium]